MRFVVSPMYARAPKDGPPPLRPSVPPPLTARRLGTQQQQLVKFQRAPPLFPETQVGLLDEWGGEGGRRTIHLPTGNRASSYDFARAGSGTCPPDITSTEQLPSRKYVHILPTTTHLRTFYTNNRKTNVCHGTGKRTMPQRVRNVVTPTV